MPRIVLTVFLLLFMGGVVPVTAQAPTITLSITPTSGPSGTSVTLQGRGVLAYADVTIFYNYLSAAEDQAGQCKLPEHREVPQFEVTADGSGQFTTIVRPEITSAGLAGIVYTAYNRDRGTSNSVCFRFQVTNSRTFPETGQTLSGRLLQFWEDNGGLPTYGYPITAAADEVNPDTKQTYLTQWFERNRFEFHPENRSPYDIQLGRLGEDRLRQLGRDWRAEGREPGPKPRCLWFPETGHNVCNQTSGLFCFTGFADYWACHGLDFEGSNYDRSLALFGLPLTEARMEMNSSGDRVLTQWFERARMEWHPDEFDGHVLLGLLGNEIRGRR